MTFAQEGMRRFSKGANHRFADSGKTAIPCTVTVNLWIENKLLVLNVFFFKYTNYKTMKKR